jgi:hypothetical protein
MRTASATITRAEGPAVVDADLVIVPAYAMAKDGQLILWMQMTMASATVEKQLNSREIVK